VRIHSRIAITSAKAREMALGGALLMLLGYHFFDGPLENRHFFVSAVTGVGLGLTFRYLSKLNSEAEAE
jgi:hypothetical protein